MKILATLLVSLALAAPQSGRIQDAQEPAAPGQEEVVELETMLVEVPVVVSEAGGRYVTDLRESDFSIFENGEPREVDFFAAVDEPFNVALMLDTSGSTREKLDRIKEAALAFVDQLRPRDRVAVVAFEDEVNVLVPLTNDRDQIRRAIGRLQTGEYTQVYEAIHTVAEGIFEDVGGRKAAILFSDGVDTASAIATFEDSLDEISDRQVIVYPIRYNTRPDVEARLGLAHSESEEVTGLERRARRVSSSDTDEVRRELEKVYRVADAYLWEISSRTGGVLHRADRIEDLPAALARIATELRQQYMLGYYPVKDDDPSERAITVTVSRPGVTIRARRSYTPERR
jgi:Ca-activated chloride channel family protein